MNSLVDYSSSSSDESDIEESENVVKTQEVTEPQSKSEISESLETKPSNVNKGNKKLSYEERIALKISEFKKQQQELSKSNKVSLNLFSVEEKKKVPQDVLKEASVSRSSKILIDDSSIKANLIHQGDELEQDTEERPQKRPKRSRGFDEDVETIDFEVDNFYNTNKEMIESGKLNSTEISHSNSTVKYYGGGSAGGHNQLSDIIRFTQQNKEQLQKNVERETAKSKEKGKQYGFK